MGYNMIEKFLRYIQFEKRYSPHTLTSYKTDLFQFQLYLEKEYELSDSSMASFLMIRSWIVSLVDEQISPKSINRKNNILKSDYKFLLRNEVIQKDPTLKLKNPKVKKSLPSFVEEANLSHLLNSVEFEDSFFGKRDKLIFELFYGTGIRLSELISLTEKSIDLYGKTLRVIGKGNKERVIPINQNLITLLKSYVIEKKEYFGNNTVEALIVTNKNQPSYPMFIQRIVLKYLKMVTTLDKKSPHVLRHTFATHMLNKGADLNAIKELLGHTSLAATQVYTHNSLEKLKKVFNQAHPKA